MKLHYESVPLLQEHIAYFQTRNLQMDFGEFRQRLEDHLADRAQVVERLASDETQMSFLRSFHWGHDHDFGDFQLSGKMGTRHIWLLSRFFDHFGVPLDQLRGQSVLDAGCWTGGVSLILERLGCEVTAIDEIGKYPHALKFLAQAFGLCSLTALNKSIYELGEAQFLERYDTVFCLGVIYHISDPIVGLRRLYQALKAGGTLCLESMSIPSAECICEYEGPSRRRGEFGWNWFVPSPKALKQWLEDTGFEAIQVGNGVDELAVTDTMDPLGPNRCLAVARKRAGHHISVAGLSTPIL
jgi:2-polyprenyl-3-methyl-5-hydroxy-6-metoxy-1,4-benzoquinol methylase